MASGTRDTGTGQIGIVRGPTTQVTAAISAIDVNVYVFDVVFCDVVSILYLTLCRAL